jgi:hypothetical protein
LDGKGSDADDDEEGDPEEDLHDGSSFQDFQIQ